MEQALLFDRRRFNQRTAQSWASAHGYKPIKYHTTPNYVRARLRRPVTGGVYRTRHLTGGIRAIVGSGGGRYRRTMVGRLGGGILDSNPAFLENLVTTALAGLAIFGIVKAVRSRK